MQLKDTMGRYLMKTINIKGKEYVMVNERIKEFRANYKGYSLESEILTLNAEEVVIKAIVKDENGRVVATGLAQENKNASMINKTSYVENCETSAWGRALGNLGIGIDASIASAEEMVNALSQQEIPTPKPASEFNKKLGEATHGNELHCSECDEVVSEKVAKYSLDKFGKVLCYNCQKRPKEQTKIEEVDLSGDELPF